jgi:hypothetical protein
MSDNEGIENGLDAVRVALETQTKILAAEVRSVGPQNDNALSLRRRAALVCLQAYVEAALSQRGAYLAQREMASQIAAKCWEIADVFIEFELPRRGAPSDHPPRGNLPMGEKDK